MKRITLFSLLVFIVDQIVKLMVGFFVKLNTSIIIIDKFFSITLVHNFGAAFSILYGNRILLVVISVIALFLIYHCMIKDSDLRKYDVVTYSLLIGGILGNLFDRIFYGYVVDYLDFSIFGHAYPIFNIADICIVISVLLIFIDVLRSGKSANRSR